MSIENALSSITSSLKEVNDRLQAHANDAARNTEIASSSKEAIDGLLNTQSSLLAQVRGLEQKLAEVEGNGAGGDVQHVSMGDRFVGSEQFKAFASQARPRGRVDMSMNAAISTAADSAGATVPAQRLPGVLRPIDQRLTVRDLLIKGRMDGSVLEYVRETGFTNAAAPVAELARKPESSMKFDLVNTSAKVIAHFMKASRQILSDNSQLASIIDGRLRYGLKLAEEAQLLAGDGKGQNLLGILPQASAFAVPAGLTATTILDRLRAATLQAELALLPSSAFVLNPVDWANIELVKDTQGRYIIGNPQGQAQPTLWGKPVVLTPAIAQGKFLAGAFDSAAQIFDCWDMRVEVATENEDDFVKNMVTVLCEERLALAVYRPQALIYGDVAEPVTPAPSTDK